MGEMKDRILRGELYLGTDEDLTADFERAQLILERYNASAFAEQDLRDRLLRELLGECGEGVHVRPPFRLEYGLRVSIGAGTFVNYDCLMLDVAPVTIGAACQVASRVQFITATHPIDPVPRRIGWETAEPIVVGDNVWLGSGATLCPGVTIGDDTVVGAGAVVAKDLPAGVVAVGVPARPIREIGEADRIEIPQL
jgi:maltose O-acetyltransferase